MLNFGMASRELWVFLFFLGVLLFNWPLLKIFGFSLPYYLFTVWGIFIAATALIITIKRKQQA